MLAIIRDEDTYEWYLHKVIYPLIKQKYDGHVFEADEVKSYSWRNVWELLKTISTVDEESNNDGHIKDSLENEEAIHMIIKDALTQKRIGMFYAYRPMWLFGSRLYWNVMNDYRVMFEQDFELYQMQRMLKKL
jgi:hypothetical protein